MRAPASSPDPPSPEGTRAGVGFSVATATVGVCGFPRPCGTGVSNQRRSAVWPVMVAAPNPTETSNSERTSRGFTDTPWQSRPGHHTRGRDWRGNRSQTAALVAPISTKGRGAVTVRRAADGGRGGVADEAWREGVCGDRVGTLDDGSDGSPGD